MPDPRPPDPPPVDRKFKLTHHTIGAAVLAVLPLLALAGLFGETAAARTVSGAAVEVTVEYPERLRYKMVQELTVRVENSTDQPLALIVVTVDTGYLDRFSAVSFTPTPTEVTRDVYRFELTEIQPGVSRVITSPLQAERYWLSEGVVAVLVEGVPAVDIPISTFVWP